MLPDPAPYTFYIRFMSFLKWFMADRCFFSVSVVDGNKLSKTVWLVTGPVLIIILLPFEDALLKRVSGISLLLKPVELLIEALASALAV